MEANDGARVWVDGVLLFDFFEANMEYTVGFTVYKGTTSPLIAGLLYDIIIEFRENYGNAQARLFWQSLSQSYELVPSYRLFFGSVPIVDSPFQVRPVSVKPSSPTGLSLTIAAWNQILVSFYPPADDGGEQITDYKVEWWSAVNGSYGLINVQQIRIPDSVTGGTFILRSPNQKNLSLSLTLQCVVFGFRTRFRKSARCW